MFKWECSWQKRLCRALGWQCWAKAFGFFRHRCIFDQKTSCSASLATAEPAGTSPASATAELAATSPASPATAEPAARPAIATASSPPTDSEPCFLAMEFTALVSLAALISCFLNPANTFSNCSGGMPSCMSCSRLWATWFSTSHNLWGQHLT